MVAESSSHSPACRGSWAILALALLLATVPVAAKKKSRSPGELTNLFLSPGYSQWLVGPIHHMATKEEIREYLSATSDEAAEELIEEFWQRRDPRPQVPGNRLRELFEERAREADTRFSEAAYLGRRTDRGTIWVLHGEPEEQVFEATTDPRDPPIEVWLYPKDAAEGLDGEEPSRLYTFAKPPESDLTIFFRPRGRLTHVFR